MAVGGDLVRPEDRAALAQSIELAGDTLADQPAPPTGPSPGRPTTRPVAPPGSATPTCGDWPNSSRRGTPPRTVRGGDRARRERHQGDRGCLGGAVSGTEELAGAALADSIRSPRYRTRLAVEQRVDGIGHSTSMSSGDADRFSVLSTAVAEVRASHAAEQEARATPSSRARRDRGVRPIVASGRRTRLRVGLRGRRHAAATSGTRARRVQARGRWAGASSR